MVRSASHSESAAGLMLLALVVAWAAGRRAAGGDAAPEDGVYTVALQNALPQDRPMVLHLDRRGGRLVGAFATGRTFNRVAYDLDVSALRLAGGRLAGKVGATVHSDGYFPADGTPVACLFAIDAAVTDAGVQGSFQGIYGSTKVSGAVAGSREPHRALSWPARFRLALENAVIGGRPGWDRRAYVGFALRGGIAHGGKIRSEGGITHALFCGTVGDMALAFDGTGLTGTLSARIWTSPDAEQAYCYRLEGTVVGAEVAGTFTTTVDGEAAEGGRFLGTVAYGEPPAASGLHKLTLHEGVPDHKFLEIYVSCCEGRFRRGFAVAPRFNHAVHDVDPSGLILEGSALKGTLEVTVRPDPWVPEDRQPIACSYTIAAALRDGETEGTFTGRFGAHEVSGQVSGEVEPAAAIARVGRVSLKLEDGLTGGNAWQNRAFISVRLEDDAVAGGSFGNPKPNSGWKGRLDAARLTLEGDTLKGTLTATVTESRTVTEGAYTVAVEGHLVGTFLTGTFTTTLEGREVKRGRFAGSVEAAR